MFRRIPEHWISSSLPATIFVLDQGILQCQPINNPTDFEKGLPCRSVLETVELWKLNCRISHKDLVFYKLRKRWAKLEIRYELPRRASSSGNENGTMYCRLVFRYIQWRQNFGRKHLAELLSEVSRRRVKSNFRVFRRKVHGLKAYGLAQDRFQWDFWVWRVETFAVTKGYEVLNEHQAHASMGSLTSWILRNVFKDRRRMERSKGHV